MLSRVSLAIAVFLLAGFLYVESRPKGYQIARSLAVQATPELVYGQLEDLRQFPHWSPWDGRDPNLQRTFEGPPRGPGARMHWQGNRQMGTGTLTITQATPPSALRYLMMLERPWQATIENDFRIVPAPAGSTVTWTVSGELGFWAKLFRLFDHPDERVGNDLETGLAKLKRAVERQ
jgi:uncharacterized protein YndB with AHSA1/START domain